MKVGIQLYSVRENMGKDPIGTIRKLTEIGYRNLEAANHTADQDPGVGFGVSAPRMNELLREIGSKIVGAHLSPLSTLSRSARERVLSYHAAVGTEYIIVPAEMFADGDDVKIKAETLNALGRECAEKGLKFAYHNHYQEFQQFDGNLVLDMLVENTDPSLVSFELDTFWAVSAGMDPIALLKRYGKRIALLHQKDFEKEYQGKFNFMRYYEERNEPIRWENFGKAVDPDVFTEIGTGAMEIPKIIDTAQKYCNVDYILLEQDYTKRDELESVRMSMAAFRKLDGLDW